MVTGQAPEHTGHFSQFCFHCPPARALRARGEAPGRRSGDQVLIDRRYFEARLRLFLDRSPECFVESQSIGRVKFHDFIFVARRIFADHWFLTVHAFCQVGDD
jgi:hypothetical protein